MRPHSLLQTKLYIPPIRPELVSRPRLIERLNAALPTRDAFPRPWDPFTSGQQHAAKQSLQAAEQPAE
jgi:hypothetical protein